MAPSELFILGSLGVNQMFPRDVARGPPTRGRLGLPHLLTTQRTSQIEPLTGHIHRNDVNGKTNLSLPRQWTTHRRHLRAAPRLPEPLLSASESPLTASHPSLLNATSGSLSPQRGNINPTPHP
jgi:hypothetical protein